MNREAREAKRRASLERLLATVDRLRDPDGCPWDRKQTVATMAPFLLEEACEVLDAVERGDTRGVCEELGDCLMVIAMMCRIAEDDGAFDLAGSAAEINAKLVRRHPHVFGDREVSGADEVLRNWDAIKRDEKREKGEARESALDGVPRSMPGLMRAYRIGEKAAKVGFEWPDLHGPRAKIDEELGELLQAVEEGAEERRRSAELGDVLFAVVNLARHLKVDPEAALRGTIERFRSRFRYVEEHLGKAPSDATLDEMEALWQAAKEAPERDGKGPETD